MMQAKVNFIGMTNTITVDGRTGELEVFTQIRDFEVTDDELTKIKAIQQEAAEKLKAIFGK